jgi:hypothetical protein
MSKLLNPNGILILSTPNKKYSGSGTNIYHVNEYSIAEFQKLLPGVKIRAISTKLLKPARMWLKLLGKERYMRISYKASLLFPFYNLPQYSRVIAAAVTKEKLDSIFASESNLSQE